MYNKLQEDKPIFLFTHIVLLDRKRVIDIMLIILLLSYTCSIERESKLSKPKVVSLRQVRVIRKKFVPHSLNSPSIKCYDFAVNATLLFTIDF